MRCLLAVVAATTFFGVLVEADQDCSQLSFVSGGETKSVTKIRQDYGPAIFRLYAGDRQGTGFLIDPASGYVVTAHHVVADEQGNPPPVGSPIMGDLADWQGRTLKFTFVTSLFSHFFNDKCQSDGGEYAGIDVALLKMSDADLKDYRSTLGSSLPLDIVLGGSPPDNAYFMGYPGKQNQRTHPPYLDPLDTTVNSDFGASDSPSPLLQWRLSKPVVPGESGAPVFDATGRVFGVLVQEDADLNSRGLALNLGEILEILKIVLQVIPLSENASTLKRNIIADAYKTEFEVFKDLRISNKELAAVILAVTSKGPPKFRFIQF